MPHDLEYIVKDALMMCDKGALPAPFTPTSNTQVKINSCLVTTKADKAPMTNIPSFGACSVKNGSPCTPAPIDWMDTYKVKVKGQETILFKSKMPCGTGGKIEFIISGQVPIPPEEYDKLMEEHGEDDDSGWGWLDVAELIPVVGSVIGIVREAQKGNWWMVGLNAAFLVADVLTLDVASAVTAPAKAAVKGAAKFAAKKVSQKALQAAAKIGTKIGAKKVGKGFAKAAAKKVDDFALKHAKVCVFACFPKGTKVHTEKGQKRIEEIKKGDLVWSWDESTNQKALKKVVSTKKAKTDIIIELHTTNGEVIKTTPTHPFKTNAEWKDALDLKIGDSLKTFDSKSLKISKILHLPNNEEVFNFHVKDFHTYYIGENLILVHNACEKNIKNIIKRLPRTKGKWLGEAGEGIWKSSKKAVNKITKGEGIPFKNGFPDFSKWSKGKIKFKNLDGTAKDFDKVYEKIAKMKGLKNKNQAKKYLKKKKLTPHHHQDGKTIELIPSALHNNVPHTGGVAILRKGLQNNENN